MIILNSVNLNAAADAMWRWEQNRRTGSARDEAQSYIKEYCEMHDMPAWAVSVILDAMMITVRIANGFPPDYGVIREEPHDPREGSERQS